MLVQWSGYADDERVHARNLGIVSGGGETMRAGGLDLGGGDTIDVRPAGLKNIHLLLVDIEAGHRKRLLAEEQRQRQANIAHSDDANFGGPRLDFDVQRFVRTDAKTLRHEDVTLLGNFGYENTIAVGLYANGRRCSPEANSETQIPPLGLKSSVGMTV